MTKSANIIKFYTGLTSTSIKQQTRILIAVPLWSTSELNLLKCYMSNQNVANKS